jgi:methylated-DNA-[protein]-cysteine S-methyltransferase
MSSSTRPAPESRPAPDSGPLRRLDDDLVVTAFSTPWGEGRLALLGELPFELELPDAAAGRITGVPAGRGAAAAAAAGDGGTERPGSASPREGEAEPAIAWVRQLERYFRAEPVGFDLDIIRFCAAHGFTGFETEIYRALAAVPYGETVSYRDLAVAAGRPHAWRAAGSAMALNPLPVILPCHRVVRSDGTLGEYGDDPAWKERLLLHEGVGVVHGPRGTPRTAARLVPARGRPA